MPCALVIGGTGPSGPFIVNGLIDRGFEVSVLHSGQHEVDFQAPVEHIHVDPHFAPSLAEGLRGRRWDVAIAGYGRLRLIVEALKGHTGRVVAITGATGGTAAPDDPRWGLLGRPALLDEARALAANRSNESTLAQRIAEAEAALFEAHAQGHFSATCIAYPILYGPRQPGPLDWAIVRRVLDGRRHFIVADGGCKLESRAYSANAAHAVLLAVDQPRAGSGRKYLVADADVHSLRQRIEAIAQHLGHAFELVDLPYECALPCHPLWRHTRESRLIDASRIRKELGYADVVPAADALRLTVDWMVAHRSAMPEAQRQLGDPFDYEREDRLIERWRHARAALGEIDYPLPDKAHIYRHPVRPFQGWTRPEQAG
jgi:nucleoside-diphosphate-sugar epimerase